MSRRTKTFDPVEEFENFKPKCISQTSNYFTFGEKLLKISSEGDEAKLMTLILAARHLKKRKNIDIRPLDVNYQNLDTGESALMVATSPKIVEILLKYGADPNLQDNFGNTALHYHSDDRNIVNLLTDFGAFSFIKNVMGEKALETMKTSRSRDLSEIVWPLAFPRDADLKNVIAIEWKTVKGTVLIVNSPRITV